MTLFERCLVAAADIVQSYKLPYEFYNFDVGGSDTSGSTKFSRSGTSAVTKEFTLPSDLAALIQQSYTNSAVDNTSALGVFDALRSILSQDPTAVPGLGTLSETGLVDPVNFSGRPSLDNITGRNPYSQDYETAIGELYDRMFAKGRALAQTGPTNVRGGTARQGFELGEMDANIGRNKFKDIREQQDKEAGVVSDAVRTAHMIEAMRRGTKLQGQQQHMAGEGVRKQETLSAARGVADTRNNNASFMALAADMLGKPTQTTTDNLKGQGNQVSSSNNWGVGLTCCFIFLQVLNGELPPVVRRGRDEFSTRNRNAGYRRMSLWLLPIMRRSRLFLSLVNWVIVKPFIMAGEWYYEDKHKVVGGLCWVYGWFWFLIWSILGTLYGKHEYDSELDGQTPIPSV